jgi:hypothetical protein
LLALGQIVLVFLWRRSHDPKSLSRVWIGLIFAAGTMALSILVVTPTEQITRRCHDLAQYAQNEDLDRLGQLLADDFRAGEFDRDQLLARAETTLERYDIDHVKLRTFDVTFNKDERATVTFNAVCRIRGLESVSGIIVSRWRLTFISRGEVWLLEHMEAIPTAFSPIRHIRDCFR